MGITQILMNIATFFTTTGGGALCVIALSLAAAISAFERHLHPIGWTFAACGFLVSASWIATTWLGTSVNVGGGGGGFSNL